MLGIGSEIAHRREAQARHHRILHYINVFVDLSRMEAAIQMDVPVAGRELAGDGLRELPFGARNDLPLAVARVAHRQHVPRVVRCGRGILDSADAAGDQVSQRNLRHLFRGHKIAAQQSGNCLSVFFRDWRVKFQRIDIWRVPLPTEAHKGKAFAKKPRVSGVVGGIPIAAVDEREDATVSAVRILQEHRAVPFMRILRTDRDQVGREFHFTIVQIDCVAKINNALVVRIRNRD